MIYVTLPASKTVRQMSLEELWFGIGNMRSMSYISAPGTITYERETLSGRIIESAGNIYIPSLVNLLKEFNNKYDALRNVERHTLYHSFKIPKHSGGLRQIDAPNDELMDALRELKTIFENQDYGFRAMYHTSAYAYVKKRCAVDAVKKHQENESRWFAKLDLHNFFGSTTLEFVLQQFSMVYPFSEVMKSEFGREQLTKALELAFLDGGLPQGTPISPLITNVMMIPIDFKLSNEFRNFPIKSKEEPGKTFNERMIYTRYADDFIISCRYDFSVYDVVAYINSVLKEFNAPFEINGKKTRYGSSSGSNWNLGVMLNKDNEITIGHGNKRIFRAMLTNYINDSKNGVKWDLSDIQHMEGLRSYYHMVEPKGIDDIINKLNTKFGVNVIEMIKNDIRTL